MERVFCGTGDADEFHYHYGELVGRGAHTQLHAHKHGHLVMASKPIGLYAIVPGGFEPVIDGVPFFDCRIVRAGVPHILFSLEEGVTEYRCWFCRYGSEGEIRFNPKEVVTPAPYVEYCDDAKAAELVQQWVEAERARQAA